MSRPSTAVLLGAIALLGLCSAAAATTVSPGTTSPSLAAIDCILDADAFGEGGILDCEPNVCFAGCEAAANRGKIAFDVSGIVIGRRYVESTVYTEFTVDAGTSGAGHQVDGTIQYDLAWRGAWYLAGVATGFNDMHRTITLMLWDRSVTGSPLVHQVEIDKLEAQEAASLPEIPIDVGGGFDSGTELNTFTAKLVRGHTYRLGLKLRAEGKGFPNATVRLEYSLFDRGAWWNDLKVAVSPDLEERIAELEARVARLEEQLKHHTHHYLTGRGTGHNNTVATTSEALLIDEGEPEAGETPFLPPVKPGTQPLPVRSVVETRVVSPPGPAATIRYSLPEPLAVAIHVYDTQGRVVTRLDQGVRSAGTYEVGFDASALPAGVYYYRLVAGNFVETRKLTLFR